jgi:hypothetical protein
VRQKEGLVVDTALAYTLAEWQAFLAGLAGGELHHPDLAISSRWHPAGTSHHLVAVGSEPDGRATRGSLRIAGQRPQAERAVVSDYSYSVSGWDALVS